MVWFGWDSGSLVCPWFGWDKKTNKKNMMTCRVAAQLKIWESLFSMEEKCGYSNSQWSALWLYRTCLCYNNHRLCIILTDGQVSYWRKPSFAKLCKAQCKCYSILILFCPFLPIGDKTPFLGTFYEGFPYHVNMLSRFNPRFQRFNSLIFNKQRTICFLFQDSKLTFPFFPS